ncbi:syntaxin-12-like [Thalassophryne amazonica]|uniref:syntaxin-12-like n=1 Tax=Thalassophryne amazonica TaxID=390379 RepID=UPI001470EC60|nr:syntaxin-12-like [Thalassophryne amazonica]
MAMPVTGAILEPPHFLKGANMRSRPMIGGEQLLCNDIKRGTIIFTSSGKEPDLHTSLKHKADDGCTFPSLQTPSSDQIEEGPMFGEAAGSVGGVQDFLSEISEEDVELLRQREEGLLQIERDMLDVSQIMKDLASMVHEQGDVIDSIEDYIQTTSSNVESANQELARANHYQRQLRKKKCYLLVAGAVVLTILIIIIAVSARK